jgi:Zn-dependent M28 family amino/carboxypeptidase
MDWARRIVTLGPRPPGSEAHQKLQELIVQALKPLAEEIEQDDFEALTPLGRVPMTNLIAKFGGQSGKAVVVSGHYDTYRRDGLDFSGANDGGSSTAFLLAFARQLKEHSHKDDVWLVFFDGEESFVAWQDNDHTYGSRHLSSKWKSDGTAGKIKAVINVDMIGDADLDLAYDEQSTRWLRDMVWETAHRLGYGQHFPLGEPSYIEDDHLPFVNAGYSAVNLIDLRYGLLNRYWHTENDTIDKLSAGSFSVVMHVAWESLDELAKRP